ncbi:MAG: cytochrome c [Verrucomicrobiota bacterium]
MSDTNRENLDYESGTANVVDMHDSVKREKALPSAGDEPIGMLPIVLGALVLLFTGGFFFKNWNGFSGSIYNTASYTPAAKPVVGIDDGPDEDVLWIDSWMADGKKVYNSCVACHQPGGQGIPGQFPPLVGSEWVDEGTARLGAILLHGINGPMKVGGQSYNGAMPAWNTFSDKKLAQVITYIRREFGSLPEGDDGVVTTEMMKYAREKFKDQQGNYTEAQLLAIPADENLEGAKVNLETGEAL